MRMEQAIKDQVNFTTKRCLLAVVLAIFQFSQIALAQITVNHDTIIWPDDGWYEVQTYENQTTICEGGRSCVVGPGLYIVINHTTGERIDDFPVEYDPGEPILTELSQPTVIGNVILWPDDGWYQVQSAGSFQTICEGGNQCEVDDGLYTLINHTSGKRWEELSVPPITIEPEPDQDPPPVADEGSEPFVEGDTIRWADDGWYQVQNTDGFSSVCEGGLSCVVEPGTYAVINHDTGQRWTIIVGDSELQAPSASPTVSGNFIYWADDGWYQVLSADNFEPFCEGGSNCEVPEGSYIVVNLTTGQRWNDIVVDEALPIGDPLDDPDTDTEGNELFTRLAFPIVDAEFSDSLDRIIMVGTNPNQLIIYDGNTHDMQSVELSSIPSSVSVSPDGTEAVVGHSASISYVDLTDAYLIKSITVEREVFDIVMNDNGYAYTFSATERGVVSVSLSTEQSTLYPGHPQTHRGTVAKLHPGGSRIYGANSSLSPDDLERFAIDDGIAGLQIDSPYHGTHDICGDVWISDNGEQLFTACGNIFRSKDNADNDMFYSGSLSHLSGIEHLDSSSAYNGVVAIPDNTHWRADEDGPGDTEVQFYQSVYNTYAKTRQLPAFEVNDQSYSAHGKFVFFSANGTDIHVIVRAAPEAGILNDFAIWTTDVLAVGLLDVDANTIDGAPSVNGDTISFSSHTDFETISSDGQITSCTDECRVSPGLYEVRNLSNGRWYEVTVLYNNATGTRPVDNPESELFEIVDLTIVDAEYSNTLDRIVAVSANSNTLNIIGDIPLQSDAITLNLPPLSVSISPDGLFAVVGHDGWVSHVDLSNRSLLATWPVTTIAADIVLSNDGYAYVFPLRDQWVSIHSVNLQTGNEIISDDVPIYQLTKAKLHTDNQSVYTVDDSIERFNINDGVVNGSARQPYQPDTDACNDLWLGADGRRIFTQCGNVFRASPSTEDDMTFNGELSELTRVTHLHHSLNADTVAVIPAEPNWWEDDSEVNDTEVQLYGYQLLDYQSALAIPSQAFSSENFEQSYSFHGRFVFYSNEGDRIYTIVQSHADSILINDFAIWSTTVP